MINRIALFNVIVLFSILSSKRATAQVISDSVLVDGHYRTFHFNDPANFARRSLVFIMHGSGGNGRDMMRSAAKLEEKSRQEQVLLVYPDGYLHYWNECRKAATSRANIENIDENTFFEKMIEYFNGKYGINSKQVFAAGMSGGGHMAYKLALTMPDRIRAITAIIANLPDTSNLDCVETKRPIPVMIINGTADSTNPYNGGMMVTGGVTFGYVRSTDRSFHYWSELAGYTGSPREEKLPDTDPADGKTIVRYTYKEKGKPEIVLLKVIGGQHNYPNDIDVYEEAWNFFKRQ